MFNIRDYVRRWGSGVLPLEIFGNFICQTVQFGEYLCDNWSHKMGTFCYIEYGVEAFLNHLFNKQLYITSKGRYWHNRKAINAKLSFIVNKNVHKLLILWQTWRGHYVRIVSQKQFIGGHVPPVPSVSAPMLLLIMAEVGILALILGTILCGAP